MIAAHKSGQVLASEQALQASARLPAEDTAAAAGPAAEPALAAAAPLWSHTEVAAAGPAPPNCAGGGPAAAAVATGVAAAWPLEERSNEMQ